MRTRQTTLTEEVAFVAALRHRDEASVLADAVREGVRILYHEALIEGYLLGRVPRERIVHELGPERVDTLGYQRDVLRRDLSWGLRDE